MAFGIKQWMALIGAGVFLIGLSLLPPRHQERRDPEFRLPEVRRAARLDSEINRADRLVQRIRWSRELSTYTVQNAVDGFSIRYPEGITREEHQARFEETGVYPSDFVVDFSEEATARYEGAIRAALTDLDRRADVVYGQYFVDGRSQSVKPDGSGSAGSGTDVYVGEVDGQAYCMRVTPSSAFTNSYIDIGSYRFTAYRGALSYCQPFLRHGLPGEHIMEWLEDGALYLTTVGDTSWDREGPAYLRARRSYFGMAGFGGMGWRSQAVEIDQCLAGSAEGCLATFTTPEILQGSESARFFAENSPAILVGSANWNTPFGAYDDYMLQDLEAEYGSDAFHAFWTSDLPVTEAFHDTFGTEMGDWLVRWTAEHMAISRPGPGLPRSAGFGGILAVSILAALSGLYARRRTVV